MIEIKNSEITFETIYKSPYAPSDSTIKDANLLLIPYQNIREGIEYCFTEYAEEFLGYINQSGEKAVKADIAITDDKYQVLEMHSLLLDIGKIILVNGVLPIALNLLSNFIYDKIKKLHEEKKNVEVRVEIISQSEDSGSKSIRYVGPASEFESIKESVKEITNSL